jgi:hypothetical protein
MDTACEIIKNNELVRGKFSLCEQYAAHQSRKEFFPLSAYISIERIVYAE